MSDKNACGGYWKTELSSKKSRPFVPSLSTSDLMCKAVIIDNLAIFVVVPSFFQITMDIWALLTV